MKINNAKIEELLFFWFGELTNGLPKPDKNAFWYQSSDTTDRQIIEKYAELHHQAVAGKLQDWREYPRGSLALIILLDQMSRNMFRGSAKAFAFDDLALEICQQGMQAGFDDEMVLMEKLFYYHPFEHAESIQHQDRCVALFSELAAQCSEEQQGVANNALAYAIEHRDIVAQFGRFPHRNKVLGRASTAAEQAYLSGGGKRFGQ